MVAAYGTWIGRQLALLLQRSATGLANPSAVNDRGPGRPHAVRSDDGTNVELEFDNGQLTMAVTPSLQTRHRHVAPHAARENDSPFGRVGSRRRP